MLKTLFQNSRRPTSRYLEMTVILSEFAYANQISSKSYTFWVRFGALTISKWLPSAILDFRKLTVYVTWPFSACYAAAYCKNFWNRMIACWVMSKNAFEDDGCPPCWILKVLILKVSIFGHVTAVVYVPNCIKIGRFFTEIWRFSKWRSSAILNFRNFQLCGLL